MALEVGEKLAGSVFWRGVLFQPEAHVLVIFLEKQLNVTDVSQVFELWEVGESVLEVEELGDSRKRGYAAGFDWVVASFLAAFPVGQGLLIFVEDSIGEVLVGDLLLLGDDEGVVDFLVAEVAVVGLHSLEDEAIEARAGGIAPVLNELLQLYLEFFLIKDLLDNVLVCQGFRGCGLSPVFVSTVWNW